MKVEESVWLKGRGEALGSGRTNGGERKMSRATSNFHLQLESSRLSSWVVPFPGANATGVSRSFSTRHALRSFNMMDANGMASG